MNASLDMEMVGWLRLLQWEGVQHAKKKPVLAYELFLEYGGEGGD